MDIGEPIVTTILRALPPRLLSLEEVVEVRDAFKEARGVRPTIWVVSPPEALSDEGTDDHLFRRTDPDQTVTEFVAETDEYRQRYRYEVGAYCRWEQRPKTRKADGDQHDWDPERNEDLLRLEARLDRKAGVNRKGGTFATGAEVRERRVDP